MKDRSGMPQRVGFCVARHGADSLTLGARPKKCAILITQNSTFLFLSLTISNYKFPLCDKNLAVVFPLFVQMLLKSPRCLRPCAPPWG